MTLDDALETMNHYALEGTPVVGWRLTEDQAELFWNRYGRPRGAPYARLPGHTFYLCELPVTIVPDGPEVLVKFGQSIFALTARKPIIRTAP